MDNLKLSPVRKTIVGVQFLFVAFGATVLVPLLVGLDPATALFTAGIGTFIFHLVTKGKVPIPAVNNAVAGSRPTSNGTKTVAPNATKRNCTPTTTLRVKFKLSVFILSANLLIINE